MKFFLKFCQLLRGEVRPPGVVDASALSSIEAVRFGSWNREIILVFKVKYFSKFKDVLCAKEAFFSSKHLKTNQVWNLTDFDLTNSINLVIRHPGINMNCRQNLENACLLKLFAAKHTFLPTSRLTVGAGEIVGHENWKYSVQPTPATSQPGSCCIYPHYFTISQLI